MALLRMLLLRFSFRVDFGGGCFFAFCFLLCCFVASFRVFCVLFGIWDNVYISPRAKARAGLAAAAACVTQPVLTACLTFGLATGWLLFFFFSDPPFSLSLCLFVLFFLFSSAAPYFLPLALTLTHFPSSLTFPLSLLSAFPHTKKIVAALSLTHTHTSISATCSATCSATPSLLCLRHQVHTSHFCLRSPCCSLLAFAHPLAPFRRIIPPRVTL